MPFRNKFTGKLLSAEMQENILQFNRVMTRQLPEYVRDEAQKVVDKAFRQEQFPDGKSSKWQQRKNDDEGDQDRITRRALLVKTGKLIASIHVQVRGKDTVAIAVLDPFANKYAQVHNEGLKAGRSGFQMPKRQFMPIPGESFPELDRKVDAWMDNQMDKIFR